jgi:hypothetical protein
MPPTKTKAATPVRQPYLKSKNAVYLWTFIGANLAIFLSLFVGKGFTSSSVDHFWQRVTTKDGIIAASLPMLAIVLAGVLNDTGKARLVFWHWHNPLPGCRAFTHLIDTDPRIDVPTLKAKLGELPHDPQAQNALWYRLYKKHSADVKISEAHKIYLLTRDMASIAALFVVLFTIGVAAASLNWKTAALYAVGLTAQYLLVARAAQNYGTRFVLNVLSEESQST